MKAWILLLLCIFFNLFMSVKSKGVFKYKNEKSEYWRQDSFCGPEAQYFSEDNRDEYCCVHEKDACQIDNSTSSKWCPNATLIPKNQLCNNVCLDSAFKICPSNAELCMHFKYGCDGRQRCEAYCSGSLEDFPYYDQTAKQCYSQT